MLHSHLESLIHQINFLKTLKYSFLFFFSLFKKSIGSWQGLGGCESVLFFSSAGLMIGSSLS